MRRQRSEVRSVLPGLLIALAFLSSPSAFSKNKKERPKPVPLFMDPDFHFSQIDSICLTPALDLRSDKTLPIALSTRGESTRGEKHIHSADQTLAETFKFSGYGTTECNAVNATLSDLKSPSDAWLHNLNFGQSNWLFVVGVEDVSSLTAWSGFEGSAIVSGYLFERQTSSIKLVWRERSMGVVGDTGLTIMGRKLKATFERELADIAVDDGIRRLVWKFEQRSRKLGDRGDYLVHNENFDTSCNQVWTTLKDTLTKDPKKYREVFFDASDRMALYTMRYNDHENRVVLRAHEAGCGMEFTQPLSASWSYEWDDLIKQVRASLAK
jgi:hypothetical protein